MYFGLALNFLCSQEGPWTGDLSASIFWLLRWQATATWLSKFWKFQTQEPHACEASFLPTKHCSWPRFPSVFYFLGIVLFSARQINGMLGPGESQFLNPKSLCTFFHPLKGKDMMCTPEVTLQLKLIPMRVLYQQVQWLIYIPFQFWKWRGSRRAVEDLEKHWALMSQIMSYYLIVH